MALDRYLLMVVAAVLVLVGRDGDRGSRRGGGWSLRGTQRGREGKWVKGGGAGGGGWGLGGLAYGCWL